MKFILPTLLILGFSQSSFSSQPVDHTSGHKAEKIEVQVNHATPADKPSEHINHSTPTPSAHHEVKQGVPASKALGWLKNGNIRYTKNKLRKDGQGLKDREHLEAGQYPHTIVLSCSDSRVPPELIFDQKLGEIFVVRTAGEALDYAALASIEYAVDHLGPQMIVVMAHDSCGAVKAAFSTLNGADAGSPALNALVKDIHPRIMAAKGHDPSPKYVSEAKANAAGVAKDLVARSKIIESKVKAGKLSIETAIYHLGSGAVEFF